MHEMGLLASVVSAVTAAAADAGATSVTTVALRVGAMSGAVPEALQGSWPIITDGTICAGATLSIETVPAAVHCPACDAEHEIDAFFALTCPACGTPTAHQTRGREFEVAWVEWDVPHAANSSDKA